MKKIALLSMLSALLVGCSNSGNNDLNWRPYQDLEGNTQHISFMMRVFDQKNPNAIKEAQGTALRKVEINGFQTNQAIGETYVLFDAEKFPMGVIFLEQNKSLNPHNPEHIKTLAKAKIFDFYEFGKQRLGIVRYRAKNGICQDFKGKAGVQLEMATNYYSENSFTDYYTNFMRFTVNHKKLVSKGVDLAENFSGTDPRLQKEMQEYIGKEREKLSTANINEKVSILANIICK